jgi:hypothetical protein
MFMIKNFFNISTKKSIHKIFQPQDTSCYFNIKCHASIIWFSFRIICSKSENLEIDKEMVDSKVPIIFILGGPGCGQFKN